MEVYKIKGMACEHCKAVVEKGLATVPGVESVKVDLAAGTACVDGAHDRDAVIAKIAALGYTCIA